MGAEGRGSPALPAPLGSPTSPGPLVPPCSGMAFLNRDSQKLVSAVYVDYARSLRSLGFRQGALLFASKAGPAGRDLVTELESPKQEEE